MEVRGYHPFFSILMRRTSGRERKNSFDFFRNKDYIPIRMKPIRHQIILLSALLVLPWLAARAAVSVVGDLSDERSVKPGESYSGTIVVRGMSDLPEEIKIYAADYLFSSDGKSYYNEPGSAARSNARWITFSPVRVLVPPQQDVTINYTVKVPAADSLTGTYWSILMIEPIPKASAEAAGGGERTIGITAVTRYAYQIITNIGDGGTRKIRFFDPVVSIEDTSRIFRVSIENTGERYLRPDAICELYDNQGREYGPYRSEKLRIFPGCSVKHRFFLGGIPRGSYKAVIVADSGEEDLFGINYTIEINQ